jgi:hypothetical protein
MSRKEVRQLSAQFKALGIPFILRKTLAKKKVSGKPVGIILTNLGFSRKDMTDCSCCQGFKEVFEKASDKKVQRIFTIGDRVSDFQTLKIV